MGTDTVPHCAVGMALVSPTNDPHPLHTGGCPYVWADWPSGVADADGLVIPATSTQASSVAPPLPTRHMAIRVACPSRQPRSRYRTVTFRRPSRAPALRSLAQQRVFGGGTFTSTR